MTWNMVCFLFLFLFRAAPAAYGSSQARIPIGAAAANLHHSRSNAESVTHWAGPGVKHAFSWILTSWTGYAEPQWEFRIMVFFPHPQIVIFFFFEVKTIYVVSTYKFMAIVSAWVAFSIMCLYSAYDF